MNLKNLFLLIISVLVSLALLEVGLRHFTSFPPDSSLKNRIYDEKLAYRMDPALRQIDENGFRNPTALEEADIVALGDSHTYGYNVRSTKAWPQQLASMTNMSVYNLGVGSYMVLQYYQLLDDAIKLKPDHIILGLYLANDLRVCKLIEEMDYWNNWAREHGYSTAPCFDSTEKTYLDKLMQTAIGSMAIHIWETISTDSATASSMQVTSDHGIFIDQGTEKTIIRNEKLFAHKNNMDLAKPEISLGFEVSKYILKEAKRKADLNGINFSILFIPSQSRVFYEYLLDNGYKLPSDYHQSVENEKLLLKEYSAFLGEIGVEFADAKPYMVRELEASNSLYPATKNSHPTEIGYKAYAEAIYDTVFK